MGYFRKLIKKGPLMDDLLLMVGHREEIAFELVGDIRIAGYIKQMENQQNDTWNMILVTDLDPKPDEVVDEFSLTYNISTGNGWIKIPEDKTYVLS